MNNKALCPFCGNENVVVMSTTYRIGRKTGNDYHAECGKCGARGPITSDPEHAMRRWNHWFVWVGIGNIMPSLITQLEGA